MPIIGGVQLSLARHPPFSNSLSTIHCSSVVHVIPQLVTFSKDTIHLWVPTLGGGGHGADGEGGGARARVRYV